MTQKPGRNDPCPCGSGKKLKRCCGEPRSAAFARHDRERVWQKLEELAMSELGAEDDEALAELWGEWFDSSEDLPPELEAMSEAVFDAWFYFDRPLEDGRLVADVLLARPESLTPGERDYLTALSESAMHLWEIVEIVPGLRLTLRDVLEETRVTVHEQTASRHVSHHEWIAARVIARGASGTAEIERGALPIPKLLQGRLREQLTELRATFLRDNPGLDLLEFYKTLPPVFHDVWAGSLLHPVLPQLHNYDGEPLLITRVSYDVLDVPALTAALDQASDLERDDESRWTWSGPSERGERVLRAHFQLRESRLVLETNSAARAEQARALLESAAGPALAYRATTHEDLTRAVRDKLRARALGEDVGDGGAPALADAGIPPSVAESLELDYLARHYRAWLDDAIPALGGASPRRAAETPALRGALVELIQGLESDYERALKAGQTAYDPSWMWAELGLAEAAPPAPPPLAHERLALLDPELAEVTRGVAQSERRRPSFDDRTTLLTAEDASARLELQRYLRAREQPDSAPQLPAPELRAYLRLLVNFELHRRKSFWVDEALAFMLAQTDLDVLGRELRVPFPSFALVFSDRHTLSLGERLLSRDRDSPVAGHILKVATIYVTETALDNARALELAFAFDALGADAPALMHYRLELHDEQPVQEQLEPLAPRIIAEPAVEDRNPVRGLLTLALNAILYATSPGVESQPRTPSSRRETPQPAERSSPQIFTSDEVFFLPGAIEISKLRHYQALERLPSGREVLRRFMVRGHWRRPAKNWTDQRPRWIAPYWKGPSMAAVIEKAYRLQV